MNMGDYNSRIEKLQQELEELKNNPPKETKWSPKGNFGVILESVKFKDYKYALEAGEHLKRVAKLLAYVEEFDGVLGKGRYYIHFINKWGVYCLYGNGTFPETVLMSRDCAEGLANKLNSGEVEL